MSFNQKQIKRVPTSNDSPTLKPCPFCGAYPELQTGRSIRVICIECGCQTETVSLVSVAVGKWNSRTEDA